MRRLLLPFTAAAALALPAPAMAVGALDQSQDGGFAGSNVVWGSVQAAQSFTAGISGDLDQVDVLLARSGSPGDLTVEIQTLSSGVPSGTVLASGSVAAASVTGSYAWIPVPLSPVAPSSAGVQYAIVLSAPSSAGSGDRYDWAITGGSPYSAGTQLSSLDGGASWTAGDPTFDSNFKTYVEDSIRARYHDRFRPLGPDLRPHPDLHLLLLGGRLELRVQARRRGLRGLRLPQHHSLPHGRLPHLLRPRHGPGRQPGRDRRFQHLLGPHRGGPHLGDDPRGHGRGGSQGQPGDHPSLRLHPAGHRLPERGLHGLRRPRGGRVHPKRRLQGQLRRGGDHPDPG